MTWLPSDNLSPSDVLNSALVDSLEHRWEDALRKFLWFHEASRGEPRMEGFRLSFALGYWMDLAAQYPAAMDAFIKLRDDTEKTYRANSGDFESFLEVSSLNRFLDNNRRTVDLFMEISRDAPENAMRIYHIVEEALVAEGMYQECAPFLEWKNRMEISISGYKIGLEVEEEFEQDESCSPKSARKHFQNNTATLVALLSLNTRREEAEQVRELSLAVLDDNEFRIVLERALAGLFPEAEDDWSVRNHL
ncbi:MAG: hypothetical protein COA78_18930 [Blastopirellula sp.]|nr:MAG: hypothetical protein COA78_18930 [Blastopirellula sp.]